jgi:hypothetical protein
MKERATILILVIVGCSLMAYLIGAFSQASFNLLQWSGNARNLIAGCYTVIMVCLVIPACFDINTDEPSK